ncbi:hypothetical protein BKA67DRAFT_314060 [Truncatella angustata]|uniref:Chitin-binding type-1 domain-containing protein n=1 Tax=Truncatella angustata TaxID=152316 RepID=A0A9P8ZXU5_9PEZI|nr:uncharacterized protein BKA67DRAFT_314060 [Truncatella angustata]KAH6653329.1 hypothetical protein BKA67DRAFT_314060 [Truncatella angustata]KAH8197071.1 hypothetical protein TruAng_008778 [Truncatella angustata]
MLFSSLIRFAISSSMLTVSLAAVLPEKGLIVERGHDSENGTLDLGTRACQYGCAPHTPTPDGSCGPTSAGYYTCRAGDCCSKWGWCGATDAHCGAGCNIEFGTCGSSSPAPPPLPPSPQPPAGKISPNGSCGPGSTGQYSCPAGNCCSSWGWCGATPTHCTNCQKGFGQC